MLLENLTRRGYRVHICARHLDQLQQAQQQLAEQGWQIGITVVDLTDARAMRDWVQQVDDPQHPTAVAIYVAGVVQVSPWEALTAQMFDDCVNIMTKGPAYMALALLPGMRESQYGRIGIVSSIGGVLPVPHLVPYCTAKFGAAGLAQSLRAELAGTGVKVTTVLPPMMRTGSHVNAQFAGNQGAEYSWFAPGAVIPGIAMNADKAARRIVSATVRGRVLVGLSPLAQVAMRAHGLAPAITTRGMGVMARLLPQGQAGELVPGGKIPSHRVHPVVNRIAPPHPKGHSE